MTIHAIADASRFFELALSAGRRVRAVRAPELADVYARWSDALYLLGRYDRAESALSAARRLVKFDPVEVAPIATKEAIIATRLGRYRTRAAPDHASAPPARRPAGPGSFRRPSAADGRDDRHALPPEPAARGDPLGASAEREARRSGAKDALADAYKFLDIALEQRGELARPIYSRAGAAALRGTRRPAEPGHRAQQPGRHVAGALGLGPGARAVRSVAGHHGSDRRPRERVPRRSTTSPRSSSTRAGSTRRRPCFARSSASTERPARTPTRRSSRRELAKLFARRGEFEAARELLEVAQADQLADRQAGRGADHRRFASARSMSWQVSPPRSRASRPPSPANRTEGGSVFVAMLKRLEAWALIQAGEIDAGERRLEETLAAARKRGAATRPRSRSMR